MLGSIAGDIIGSVYEFSPIKRKEFPLFAPNCTFTDDTLLTIAVAESLLTGKPYLETMRAWGRRYPGAGWGGRFGAWLQSDDTRPYGSYGNGSAMRVGPVGFAYDTEQEVLRVAERTAAVSHNHPEGIKGAQATALAILLARQQRSKEEIRAAITSRFGYDLTRTVDGIRPTYRFDESCQRTVPEAILCFLDATTWEDAIRNAISLGGDADTLACISGGIAEAFYGPVSPVVRAVVRQRLDPAMWEIAEAFCQKYALA
jgi:ADP-ribosylglycohydrolase